jgi:hypothetical protein
LSAVEQLLEPGENLILYGPTNAGKTTQLRKIIEATASKERPWRVYSTREPSTLTILRPLEALGLCQIVYYHPKHDPFIWIDNAAQGRVPEEASNRWKDGEPAKLAGIGFDSLSGQGDLVLNGLGVNAANGYNVGGEPAPGLKIQAAGQEIMVPSGSRSHYLVAQRWLLGKVWESQLLPVPTVYTAHEDVVPLDKKHADGEKTLEIAASLGIRGVVGPMVAGSALTANLPKYFVFTFRLVTVPADASNKHVMFTGNHKDGALQGIANARCDVPVRQDPTDVVAMLKLIRKKLGAS